MAAEDRIAGKVKQAKGKANDVAGAVKGKVQKAVGKAQEKLGGK